MVFGLTHIFPCNATWIQVPNGHNYEMSKLPIEDLSMALFSVWALRSELGSGSRLGRLLAVSFPNSIMDFSICRESFKTDRPSRLQIAGAALRHQKQMWHAVKVKNSKDLMCDNYKEA